MKKAIIFTVLALVSAFSSANAFQNITPSVAYSMMASGQAIMLDVRTPEEWAWVGHPGANKLGAGSEIAAKVFNIAFEIEKPGKGYELIPNNLFMVDVAKLNLASNQAIMTLCRSGSRSVKAAQALEADGYTNVYNVVGGFEGGTDSKGYRTVASGWKNLGFPYTFGFTGNIDESVPGN
ncbi:MAG: rhodanese-like domain-containing protein [Geobacteraceae bacterium]|nr:rhodanese-like domain-containing protein [Geobacteraceae bacterium]